MKNSAAMSLDLPPAQLRMLLDLFDRHIPGAEVWAYGSRVTGQSHTGSDLDLVVRNPGQPDLPRPNLAGLRAALRESRLPVLVETHDWARLPGSFRREIEQHHVVLTSPSPAPAH